MADCQPLQVAAAVAEEINRAAEAGELSQEFEAVYSFASEIEKLEDVNTSDGLIVDVVPHMTPEWAVRSVSTRRHDLRVKIGIRRRIETTDRDEDGKIDTDEITAYCNLLYEILNLFAIGRKLTDLPEVTFNLQAKPLIQLYDEVSLKAGLYVGWIHLPFIFHERLAP
jgi:hypothetical protein